MKKPILLISKVEVIEVPDEGSNVIECTKECHGDLFPITPDDMSIVRRMTRELEYADVKTFIMCEDVTPEGMRPGTDILRTETKIAMTRDVQTQLGKPFETINAQAKELSELRGVVFAEKVQHRLTAERLVKVKKYNEAFVNMSIWGRIKFLLLARVW